MDRTYVNDLLTKLNLKALDNDNLSVNPVGTEILCLYFNPKKELLYLYAPLLKITEASLSKEFLIKVLALNTPTKNDLNLRYGLLNGRLWQSVTLNAFYLENLQFSFEDFLQDFLKELALSRESLLAERDESSSDYGLENLSDLDPQVFNNAIIWG